MVIKTIYNLGFNKIWIVTWLVNLLSTKTIFAASSGYQLLEPNFLTGNQSTSLGLIDYLRYLYQTLFVVVFVASILALVFGGLEYVLADTPVKKGWGKQFISNALWGLAIALISYLLLRIINPELVSLNLLNSTSGVSGGSH